MHGQNGKGDEVEVEEGEGEADGEGEGAAAGAAEVDWVIDIGEADEIGDETDAGWAIPGGSPTAPFANVD